MPEISDKTKFKAIIDFQCPACRSAHIFKDKKKYNLFDFQGLHKDCQNCGQDLEIEPGFEFGAMYISYGFNTAYFVICSLIIFFTIRPQDIMSYVILDLIVVLGLLPFTIRFCKVLNLYWMAGIKYGKPRIKRSRQN